MKRKKSLSVVVSVTYPASCYPDKDHELRKLVGRIANDSGIGMGERDLHWYFKNPLTAFKAFKAVMGHNPTMRVEYD